MKVLQVITGLDVGGAEMMLVRLLKIMNKQQLSFSVVSFRSTGTVRADIAGLGIPVKFLNGSGLVSGLLSSFALASILRREKPDLVHAWLYRANLITALASFLSGRRAPVLWSIRNSLDSMKDLTQHGVFLRPLLRILVHLSHVPEKIIYNSYSAARTHEARGFPADKTVIISNGIDATLWKPDLEARRAVRAELKIDESVPVIGLIGRFDPTKDHATFFRAASLFLEKKPNVHFVLAGAGMEPTNPKLSPFLSEIRSRSQIHLLGRRSDIPALTAALDVATCSSKTESFPNVVLEAMACGLCVVATDVGDCSRIVGHYGAVVPVENPQALATAWEEVLARSQDERTRIGNAAREHIIENYVIADVAKHYEKLYETR